MAQFPPLQDSFGRQVTYLRLSVTDRCDLRCQYCMSNKMQFLPKSDLLSYEELQFLCEAFIRRGVHKIRISGGEPLVRKDVMQLIAGLGQLLDNSGLQELTLTSNATQLPKHATALVECGVRRVNVSLDTLDKDTFARLSRRDALHDTLAGIDAALEAGLKVKINTVALKNYNQAELPHLIDWAHQRGMDISIIETMPMGFIDEDRFEQYMPLLPLQEKLVQRLAMQPSDHRTGGPATYFLRPETGRHVGFITPLTNNFCAGCNRVRVTCTGEIYTCLGQDGKMDLRQAIQSFDETVLQEKLDEALLAKPKGHDFEITKSDAAPATQRHMSVTGG
ncbi:MAG: GTP 3',8-cyclase MoaA [Rhodobiaceae bacterium]|nr:GTP 3',8-cyclase MoaA [Rhodobiaceae bacterium]